MMTLAEKLKECARKKRERRQRRTRCPECSATDPIVALNAEMRCTRCYFVWRKS